MSAWKPDQSMVNRYGEVRAAEFACIKAAQSTLTDAFDSLAAAHRNHTSVAEAAWCFDYLWALLDERRESTLAMPKTEPTS